MSQTRQKGQTVKLNKINKDKWKDDFRVKYLDFKIKSRDSEKVDNILNFKISVRMMYFWMTVLPIVHVCHLVIAEKSPSACLNV